MKRIVIFVKQKLFQGAGVLENWLLENSAWVGEGGGGGGDQKDRFYQDNYIVGDGGLTWFIEGYRSFEVSLTD